MASAARLRVSAVSLALVVSGFELENLAAGIAANAKGLPGAAAGTFLGGTTFLALGVAGIGAVIAPIHANLPRPVLVWLFASPFPLLLLSLDGELSRLDGGVLIAWFVIAMVGMVRSGAPSVTEESRPSQRGHPFGRIVAGLGILTAGGVILGDGLRRVVIDLGVSQTLLGNTAIAASVEAEEVGRVAVPARRGRSDVALANIAGTIVHFTAFNAGAIALIKPLHLDSDSLHLHLPVCVAATALLSLSLWFGRALTRGVGGLLLLLYGGYLAAAIVAAT